MTTRRVLLPGMPLPVDDYLGLVASLPGDTVVLDTLVVPVTGTTAELRAGVDLPEEPYELVGHSIGALAALEWAAHHPLEVSRIVLLDPSDPWGTPVPAALGGRAGRVVVSLVRFLASQPRIALALGRWGRRTVLSMYGVSEDPMPRERVDAVFGTRDSLASVARQIASVPAQVERVRALLDAGFEPPDVVMLIARDGNPPDREASVRLAERLGARVIAVPGTHLFPMTHPGTTTDAMLTRHD